MKITFLSILALSSLHSIAFAEPEAARVISYKPVISHLSFKQENETFEITLKSTHLKIYQFGSDPEYIPTVYEITAKNSKKELSTSWPILIYGCTRFGGEEKNFLTLLESEPRKPMGWR